MKKMTADRQIKIFNGGTGYLHIFKKELLKLGLSKDAWVRVTVEPINPPKGVIFEEVDEEGYNES